jgi:hypothetical protein
MGSDRVVTDARFYLKTVQTNRWRIKNPTDSEYAM